MKLDNYIEFRAVNTHKGYDVYPFDVKMTIPDDLHISLVVEAFKTFMLSTGWAGTLVNRIKYDENSL